MSDPAVRVPVAIAGGGPAGAAIAHRLALAGVPALVIERGDGSGNPVGESLGASINPLLARLGLAAALETSRPLPSHANRSCWGSADIEERHRLSEPYGEGWHLDRPAFNRALLDAAEDAGATVWRGATVAQLARLPGGGWRLAVAVDGAIRDVEAGLVADAGGRSAPIARRLGVPTLRDDRLAAAWTSLPGGERVPGATFVEAAEHGWWYAAPTPRGDVVVAFFSDPEIIAAHGAWRPDGWLALRAQAPALSGLLAGTGAPERIRIAAAGSGRLERAGGTGWLAAGDAAATHDPLASHGIGSAIATGAQAADALLSTMAGRDDAIADYAARFAPRHSMERRAIAAVYAQERRWPDAPFWRRRLRLAPEPGA